MITTTKERLVLSRDEPKQRDISRTGLATVTDRLPLFLGGCLIALAGIAAFAPNLLFPQAEAALAETCLNVANPADDDDAGQITGWQLDGTTFDDVRGIKSNVQVASSAECQRISTLNILSPTQNGVFEFGWIRGWWGSSPCVNVNYNTFYMQPTLFQVSFRNDGTYQCRFFPTKHPDGGQADTFQASDTNADYRWGGWWNGVEQQPGTQGIVLDFNRGIGVVNMERGHWDDLGYARFDDIHEYHDGNGWSLTDDMQVWYDHDNGYNFTAPNAYTALMAAN